MAAIIKPDGGRAVDSVGKTKAVSAGSAKRVTVGRRISRSERKIQTAGLKPNADQLRTSKTKKGAKRTSSTSLPEIIASIETGFRFDALSKLSTTMGLSERELAEAAGISTRTLQRRRREGKFTSEESDRLYRLMGIAEMARILFEDDVAAMTKWLTSPNRGLGGATPIDYAKTGPGAREVENLIGRILHGIPS